MVGLLLVMAGQGRMGNKGGRNEWTESKTGKLGGFCGGGAQSSQVNLIVLIPFLLFTWGIVV